MLHRQLRSQQAPACRSERTGWPLPGTLCATSRSSGDAKAFFIVKCKDRVAGLPVLPRKCGN